MSRETSTEPVNARAYMNVVCPGCGNIMRNEDDYQGMQCVTQVCVHFGIRYHCPVVELEKFESASQQPESCQHLCVHLNGVCTKCGEVTWAGPEALRQ